jgi:hypothetical protein
MSGMEIVYSPPEAVHRLRDLAETMIQLNGGLTEDICQLLDKKADEFGVHRLDMEDILKEVHYENAQISGAQRADFLGQTICR